MPTRYNRWFLLQILLLAQHVSGTTMPIIRSSRVLYRWLLPVVFGALVFKLSVWCEAEGYVSDLRAASSSPQIGHITYIIWINVSLYRTDIFYSVSNFLPKVIFVYIYFICSFSLSAVRVSFFLLHEATARLELWPVKLSYILYRQVFWFLTFRVSESQGFFPPKAQEIQDILRTL